MPANSVIDFTKRVKNITVRYVSSHLPTEQDLDEWIVLPLYQHGQDMPIDNDGRTSLLLANVPTLYRLLMGWEQKTNKVYRKQNKIVRSEEMKHEEMENQLGELKCARNIKEVKTMQVVDYLRNNLKKCMDGSSGKTKTIEYAKISPPPLASSETVHEVAQINCNSQKEETDKREYMSNGAISSFCKNRLDEILENAINTNKEKEDDRQEQLSNHFSSVLNSEAEHAASNLEKELKGLPQEWRQFSNADTFIHKKVELNEALTNEVVKPLASKPVQKKISLGKVKHRLLQRIKLGPTNIGSTSAAACEDDFVSTFCYTCRKDLLTSKALYMHNLKCHTDGELHCDICGKHLKNRITLMKHKKLHLAPEQLLYTCNNCGKRFKDKRALTAHITYTRHITEYT